MSTNGEAANDRNVWRIVPGWAIALVGGFAFAGVFALGLQAWRRSQAVEYRKFASPDSRFEIAVYIIRGRGAMPGQGSDSPGYFQLRDTRTGRVIRERSVEMVQLVDRVEWSKTNVDVRLLAEWRLPE